MKKNVISTHVYNLIKYLIIAGLAIGFFVLIGTSMLIMDTKYIELNPTYFLQELLIIGGLTALPVIYLGWMRRGQHINDFYGFLILFVKIALIHLCFQLSGVYTILFPPKMF
jgi:hypothetical protein